MSVSSSYIFNFIFSKDLLAIFMLWLYLTFYRQGILYTSSFLRFYFYTNLTGGHQWSFQLISNPPKFLELFCYNSSRKLKSDAQSFPKKRRRGAQIPGDNISYNDG